MNRTNTAAESITWYLDGTQFFQVNENQVPTATWQAAIDHNFSIIFDLAMGGGYPNGVCGCGTPTSATSSGATMSVAYVAAYESTGSTTSPTPTPTPTHTPTPTPTPSPTPTPTGGGGKSCTTVATSDISADCFAASKGTISVTATGDSNPSGVDGNQAAQLVNGDYLEYSNINFGSGGSSQFDARVASGAAGGVSGLVEVVLDNPANAPVGTFAVGNTGGWSAWKTVPANISRVTGTHNVYLEFASGAGRNPPYVSLHYFSFPAS